MFRPFFYLCLSILVFIFLNCEKELIDNLNNPPVIIKLVAVPLAIVPQAQTTLTVFATDPDAQELTFRWGASGGTFSLIAGASVNWTAPDTLGEYLITVVADDGMATDTAHTIIQVKEIFGQLKVTSTPDSADIIINGDSTGHKTPHTFDQILIGEHVVRVKKPGFTVEPDSMIVTISENRTAEVAFLLSQNFGNLQVISTPDQADIFLNGQNTGRKTPHTFQQLAAGAYLVKVTKDGYAPDSSIATVIRDSTVLAAFTLVQNFGKLEVSSNPPEANIFLDGHNTNQKTPYTFQQVAEGSHLVKVVKDGYAPDSSTVTVIKDSTVQVSFNLAQNLGNLEVTSNPDQADIILDGQNTGQQTPHTFQQIPEGVYVVKVFKSGFSSSPDSIVVNVIKNQTAQAHFTLTHTFGGLRVTSTPTQAEIILDGQNTGQITPHTFGQLIPGDYVVEVQKSGYVPDQDSLVVTVQPGDTVDAHFTMSQSAAVQGHVYFANTLIPIEDVVVTVASRSDSTDNSGFYFVDDVAPGAQTLHAAKPDFDDYTAVINLTPGQTLTKTIEMTSSVVTHTITGQITNSLGLGVVDALVTLLNPDDTPSNLSDLTGANGNYQIPTVPQGDRRIKIEHASYVDEIVDISVSSGSTNFNVQLIANPLDPPTNLTISADWNDILLNWDEITAPTLAGYNLYRSQNQSIGYQKINTSLIPTNTYQDMIDTLTIPSSYYYKVSAVNVDGLESELSDFSQYSTPTSWNGTATWNGVFRLGEDFTVGQNNILIIEAGSQILLRSSKRIVVQGELQANASMNNQIYFKPYNGDNLDIKFGFFSGSATGYFDYCTFQGSGFFDIDIASSDSVAIRNSAFLPAPSSGQSLSFTVTNGRLNVKNSILNSVVGVKVHDDLKMENSALFNSLLGVEGSSTENETIRLVNNLLVSNGQGARVPNFVANVQIDHNVFVNSPGNYGAQSGRGIEYETVTSELYEWDVTNNIIIDNRIGIYNHGSQTNSRSTQDYNNVWNNLQDYGGFAVSGPNSISADPLFVNPDYTNPMNGDWSLEAASPCIGTGSNGTDIGLLDANNIGPQ